MRTLRKLTWVELKLFAREPVAVIFTFGFPLVLLLVLIASFGTEPDDEAFGGLRPSDYYLAAYVAVVIAAIGLVALPVHMASYRERQILRRFKASSVPAWSMLGAQAIVGLLMAALGGSVLVVAGRLAYGTALPGSVGAVAAAFVLGTLAFLALGFLLATLAPSARAAQAIGMILFFPMWLLSGAAPPPDVMGETMRRVSDALPLTYVVRGLQEPVARLGRRGDGAARAGWDPRPGRPALAQAVPLSLRASSPSRLATIRSSTESAVRYCSGSTPSVICRRMDATTSAAPASAPRPFSVSAGASRSVSSGQGAVAKVDHASVEPAFGLELELQAYIVGK